MSFMVLSGYFNKYNFMFLVARHTKDECDGAFSPIKRRIRTNTVLLPASMHKLVKRSAHKNECIAATELQLIEDKSALRIFLRFQKLSKSQSTSRSPFADMLQVFALQINYQTFLKKTDESS